MSNSRCKRRKTSIKVKFIIITALVFIIAVIFDSQMRPLIKSVAKSQAQTFSTNVINQVVLDELSRLDIDYSDIVDIQKDNDGKILAVSTDMKKGNSLKSTVTMSIQDKIATMDKQEVKIPLGTFSGTELLNGHGPKISVRVSMSGGVVTDFKSEFVAAGINQTKHRLYLDVVTDALALIPGYPVDTTVSTSFLIAETIIVGDVPTLFAGGAQ